jgi:hypothetical protein
MLTSPDTLYRHNVPQVKQYSNWLLIQCYLIFSSSLAYADTQQNYCTNFKMSQRQGTVACNQISETVLADSHLKVTFVTVAT